MWEAYGFLAVQNQGFIPMLCPQCGVSVGDLPTLCDSCQEAAKPEKQTELERPKQTVAPRAKPTPQIKGAHEDPLIDIFNFLGSPPGIALGLSVLYMISWVGAFVLLPKYGVFGAATMGLAVLGSGISLAGKYAFPFDNTVARRYIMQGSGLAIMVLGIAGTYLQTGKSVGEIYDDLNGGDSQYSENYYGSSFSDRMEW